jgi:hypothetical protein
MTHFLGKRNDGIQTETLSRSLVKIFREVGKIFSCQG